MINEILLWISINWLELLGLLTGLIYLYFAINEKIWLWPFGIATSVLYIFIYFFSKIYADMGLQFYYVAISIYGWYQWTSKSEKKEGSKLKISKTSASLWLWLIIATAVLFVLMAYILIHYTDSPVPYIDAFTTSASIVATWMLAKKLIEQWLWWIVIDAISIGLYLYRELYLTVILFAVYTLMAIIGFIKWKKQLEISKI